MKQLTPNREECQARGLSIPEVRRRKAIANFFIGKIKHTVKRVRKEDPKK